MADNMSRLMEGPFRDTYTIRRVRPQDVDKVIQHIKDYFLRDEPVSKLAGYTEEFGEEFCHVVKHFLPHNLSVWMEDNKTGDVAALRITFICRKDDNCWDTFPRKSRASQLHNIIGNSAEAEANIYERYGITEYVDYYVASCAPNYRNQGLTKELCRRSLELLKAEGLPLVMSLFTSPFTRAAVKRFGFEELSRVYYKDVKDSDGKLAFDASMLDDEHFAAVMVKRI